MKVILRQTVEGLGSAGDVVTVANGHARNYLIPMQLAIQATEKNQRQLEHEKRLLAHVESKAKQSAEELAGQITAATCTIQRRAGENNRLFGSVTPQNIAEALAAQLIEIDRRHIELDEPIRELGIFTVPIRLHSDIVANLQVIVEPEA